MSLPDDVRRQLEQFKETLVARGDIYFLPYDRVVYGNDADPHPHPCLVAAVDLGRAHLIAGTSGNATGPALVVEIGETDLPKRTEFDFRGTWTLSLAILAEKGSWAGRLAPERDGDIIDAINASGNPAVRRLRKLMDS